jgi:hypothetical protein
VAKQNHVLEIVRGCSFSTSENERCSALHFERAAKVRRREWACLLSMACCEASGRRYTSLASISMAAINAGSLTL